LKKPPCAQNRAQMALRGTEWHPVWARFGQFPLQTKRLGRVATCAFARCRTFATSARELCAALDLDRHSAGSSAIEDDPKINSVVQRSVRPPSKKEL